MATGGDHNRAVEWLHGSQTSSFKPTYHLSPTPHLIFFSQIVCEVDRTGLRWNRTDTGVRPISKLEGLLSTFCPQHRPSTRSSSLQHRLAMLSPYRRRAAYSSRPAYVSCRMPLLCRPVDSPVPAFGFLSLTLFTPSYITESTFVFHQHVVELWYNKLLPFPPHSRPPDHE